MLVSFIIPTICDKRIYDAINSVIASETWSDNDCELLVVVNGNYKKFYEELTRNYSNYSSIKILYSERASISIAKNKALSIAKGKYIVHMDSDCILDREYTSIFRRCLTKQSLFLARGVIIFRDNGSWFSRMNCLLRVAIYNTYRSICFTPNLIVKREFYNVFGLYDVAIYYGEDTEWSSRIDTSKYEIKHFNNLIMIHKDDPYFVKTVQTWFRYGVGYAYRVAKSKYLTHDGSPKYYKSVSCPLPYFKKQNLCLLVFLKLFSVSVNLGYFFGRLALLGSQFDTN